MYPALLRYMSILFLNILTLLALTQSADNLFHSFTVLCENENFLISNLHCFFANVTPCPLVQFFCQVILLSLIFNLMDLAPGLELVPGLGTAIISSVSTTTACNLSFCFGQHLYIIHDLELTSRSVGDICVLHCVCFYEAITPQKQPSPASAGNKMRRSSTGTRIYNDYISQ